MSLPCEYKYTQRRAQATVLPNFLLSVCIHCVQLHGICFCVIVRDLRWNSFGF